MGKLASFTAAVFVVAAVVSEPHVALSGNPMDQQPQEAVNGATGAEHFSGLFMLLSADPAEAIKQVDKLDGRQDYLAGVTARAPWRGVNPAPQEYDFLLFAQIIQKVQSKNPDGLVNITIFGSDSPTFVENQAEQTWYVPETRSSGGDLHEEPVPWDENSLASWEQLYEALGNHEVRDINRGGRLTPLRDHSGVGSVLASVPGLGLIRDRSAVHSDATPIWAQPNFSREKLIAAVDRSIGAVAANFSRKNVDVGFFPFTDGKSPRLDELIAESLSRNYPRVGGFMENLTKSSPVDSADLPVIMLHERSSESDPPKNWFQACGIWASGAMCNFKPGDYNPMDAIRRAADDLYADIVEIYVEDVETFGSSLTEANLYLKEQAGAP